MSEEDYAPPPAATARDVAVEALLTEKALWGLLGCVLLIVLTMCTNVEGHLAWYPVTLDVQGFLALAGMSISTILLRNKALHGGSNTLVLLAVIVLGTFPLLVGCYSALYVGAYGLAKAAMALNAVDAIFRLFYALAGLAILRDTLRLVLSVKTFSLQSPLLKAMENDAASQLQG